MTTDDTTGVPTTDAVPDFAAWSRLLRGFADDIADGSGVSQCEILDLRLVAAWFDDHDPNDVANLIAHYRVVEPPDEATARTNMRDHFAMAALTGMLADGALPIREAEEATPQRAYDIADEMLRVREGKRR